jgi:hypothetical protein
MTIEQSKRNTKHFTFRDERFFIIFVGNGEDITPAEANKQIPISPRLKLTLYKLYS